MTADWLLAVARAVADAAEPDWEESDGPSAKERIESMRETDAALAAALEQIFQITRSHHTLTEAETLAIGGQKLPLNDPQEGDTWRHLVIGSKLGQGAHGVVYSATDSVLDRPVALKLVPSSGRTSEAGLPSEVVEGRLLARVNHPNVVTVFGADELAGLIGIWMEYVQGESLTEVLERQGPLGEREAALIGIEVARAAAALHQRGIVHRDIKAQNVMRERGGRIVLMDLGVSLESRPSEPSPALRGTPLYLAPELLEGEEASPTTDVYSLGVLIFFLCTRRYPVEGSTWQELRAQHRASKRQHLTDLRPDVDPRFAAILERAFTPQPQKRFQSMGELESALTRYLSGFEQNEGRDEPVAKNRLAPLLAVGLLVVVALAAFLLFWFTQQDLTQRPSSRVAVIADIDNRTDDSAIDEAIEQLLEFALLESRILEPLSHSARNAALKRMQYQEAELPLDRAAEVVRREGLAAAIGGSVDPIGDQLRVRLVASDASGHRTERILVSKRESLVAALGEQIPLLLSEVQDSPGAPADLQPLEEVTTSSLEALERFSEAQQLRRQGKYDAAVALLETAVETDPGFAMAWNRLADYQSGAGRHAASVPSSARAYELRATTTERERRHIQALYHRIRLQHYQAAQEFERLAALGGPGLANTYHQIALAYEWVPDHNRAARAARLAAQADPADVINRGMHALFEAKRGDTSLALELIRQARSDLDATDQPYLYWAEGTAHQIAGQLESAIAAYSSMVESGSSTYVRFGRSLRAQAHVEAGNTAEALVDLELLATDAERIGDDNAAFLSELWTARILAQTGLPNRMADSAWVSGLLDPQSPRSIERGRRLGASLAQHGHSAAVVAIEELLVQLAERFPSTLSHASALQMQSLLALSHGELGAANELASAALREHRDQLGLQVAATAARALGETEREGQLLTELVEQRKGEVLRFGFIGDWLSARDRLAELRGKL